LQLVSAWFRLAGGPHRAIYAFVLSIRWYLYVRLAGGPHRAICMFQVLPLQLVPAWLGWQVVPTVLRI
jgi:hypothetical protein